MGRPRQVSDEQILTATREAVLSLGPGVSLEQVAEQLAVSAPALLKRFGSRKELLLAALSPPEHPEWIAKLDRGPSEKPLVEQLRGIFTDIEEFMRQVLPCMMALRESGIPHTEVHKSPHGPEKGLKALQKWLSAARTRGLVTADDLEACSYAMLGAVQMRSFLTHILRREFSTAAQRRYIDELARLFTRTLTP
jgi:AcrR family transcriptional regulator